MPTQNGNFIKNGTHTMPYVELERVLCVQADGFVLGPITASFTVGEFAYITGEGRAGRSMFLQGMCGILKKVQGRIIVNGTDAKDISRKELGRHFGYLTQRLDLHIFAPTVWQEAIFLGIFFGKNEDMMRDDAQYWLTLADLWLYRDTPTYALTQYQKKKLAIVSMLIEGRRFLLLDEPLDDIEGRYVDAFCRFLQGLVSEAGVSIVATCRDERLEIIAKRKILLFNGEIEADVFL